MIRFQSVVLIFFGFLLGTGTAFSSADLDRRYALESVGYLKPWDNVDGIFGDIVETSYREYFLSQSRFKLVDLGQAQKVLDSSKVAYIKLIEDEKILTELAKAKKVESLIRSRIQKEGTSYRIKLEWILVPEISILSEVDFVWAPPKTQSSTRGWQTFGPEFKKALGRLVGQVPILGQVSGREGKKITINIGENAGLRPGDRIKIGTLEDAKRHPKLKTIVGWNFEPAGEAIVTNIEESISFARITEEDKDRPIARYQKITRIVFTKNDLSDGEPSLEEGDEKHHVDSTGKFTREKAPEVEIEDSEEEALGSRLGFANIGLWLGTMTRDFSANGSTGKKGDAFFYGARVDSELYLTEAVFGDFSLGGALSSYSQRNALNDVPTSVGDVSGSQTLVQVALGYRHFFRDRIFQGPSGYVRGGYRMNQFSLPSSISEETGSSTYHMGFVGIGTDVPIRGPLSLHLGFDIGLINNLSEQVIGPTGNISGVSTLSFTLAGSYSLSEEMSIRAGFEFAHNGADLGPQGAATGSVSQRTFSFIPALVYFF